MRRCWTFPLFETAVKEDAEMDAVLAVANQDFERHVDRLQRYIRQKSISAEKNGNEEMAAILAADIVALGGQGKVVPGIDFPIVYGRFDVGAERTVLIHSMYDTTPADEAGWVVPPFEARRLDFEDFGECIVGRGAEDTKGPVAAILNMIDSHRRAERELPVNLILLFEASELGSLSMPAFIEAHADELKADVAYWPWHTQRSDGTAVVWLGAKGLMTFKLRVRAGDWGGPARADIHGLHSSWIASPAQRLVAALASLKTENDLNIAVDGFYGKGDPITADDERLVQILAQRLDEKTVLRDLGAARFKQNDTASAIRAHCFQSELNISGLKSGYVIEGGHKVVLSNEAVASLDLRPLDGMSVPQVVAALRRHFDEHGFSEVEIEVLNGYVGGRLPVAHWAVQELLGAYHDCGFDPEIWPRTATAIAVELFRERLGIPWIATCPGCAGRKHSANEFIQLSSYRNSVPFMCRLIWRLAQSGQHSAGAAKGTRAQDAASA
jgi:acetylornithine deacetylase/succinyl-diaminopimelate desuccinylase-like protein